MKDNRRHSGKEAEVLEAEATEKFSTRISTTFKNNDQLKTNTALQMPALKCCYRGESAKIEFKVI